jgi:hypothetical protein
MLARRFILGALRVAALMFGATLASGCHGRDAHSGQMSRRDARERAIAIQGVRLVDGTGAPAIENATIADFFGADRGLALPMKARRASRNQLRTLSRRA